MKRVAFYRRPSKSVEGGFKERIVWMLSKGDMTGREICERMKLDRSRFGAMLKHAFKGKVVLIERYGRYVDNDGEDYWYHLASKPKFIAPAAEQTEKQIVISPRRRDHDPQECRRVNIERAARRARLIKAGLYIDEFN